MLNKIDKIKAESGMNKLLCIFLSSAPHLMKQSVHRSCWDTICALQFS